MSSKSKNLSTYDETTLPDCSGYKFGIVVAEWNQHITHALYDGCRETLLKHGVNEENIKSCQVPGTFELPTAAKLMADTGNFDTIICIGCVITGETKHDEYICHAVSQGLVNLSLQTSIPCIFGVLTPKNEEQAIDRAGGKYGNKGVEAAYTGIRMAELKNNLS